MRLIPVSFCLISFFLPMTSLFAASTSTVTSVSTKNTEKRNSDPGDKKWSVEFEAEHSTNLKSLDDADSDVSNGFRLSPSYVLNNLYSTSADVSLTQSLSGEEKTELNNIRLYLRRQPKTFLSLSTTYAPSLFGDLPTNEDNRIDNTFRGAVGSSLSLAYNFYLLGQSGKISYTPSVLKNFHEFESSNADLPNLSYRVRHSILLSQELGRFITVSALGYYQTGWTYQNAFRTFFHLSQKISLNITSNSSIFLGHSNEGDSLQANGVDTNIALYDQSNSSFSAGIAANF